jgi:hypothetical protein
MLAAGGAGFPWWCEGDLSQEAEWLRSVAVSQLVGTIGQACSGASVCSD